MGRAIQLLGAGVVVGCTAGSAPGCPAAPCIRHAPRACRAARSRAVSAVSAGMIIVGHAGRVMPQAEVSIIAVEFDTPIVVDREQQR